MGGGGGRVIKFRAWPKNRERVKTEGTVIKFVQKYSFLNFLGAL